MLSRRSTTSYYHHLDHLLACMRKVSGAIEDIWKAEAGAATSFPPDRCDVWTLLWKQAISSTSSRRETYMQWYFVCSFDDGIIHKEDQTPNSLIFAVHATLFHQAVRTVKV